MPKEPEFDRKLDILIKVAIEEDLGKGDITSEIIIPRNLQARGNFVVKEPGVIAGLPVAGYVLKKLNSKISFKALAKEGDRVERGTVVAEVKGPARAILAGERLTLNFLQRLSGIATLTRKFVEKVKGYPVVIMDTRKTSPGMRFLEKYAVRMGGGENHRMGLYDQVLVKDNHLKLQKGHIAEAVRLIKEKLGRTAIEVEAKNVEEVREAIRAGVDIIMFDNMSMSNLTQSVEEVQKARVHGTPQIEVSGGITLENVEEIARRGVDRISIGALTHSAKALDISLELI